MKILQLLDHHSDIRLTLGGLPTSLLQPIAQRLCNWTVAKGAVPIQAVSGSCRIKDPTACHYLPDVAICVSGGRRLKLVAHCSKTKLRWLQVRMYLK